MLSGKRGASLIDSAQNNTQQSSVKADPQK